MFGPRPDLGRPDRGILSALTAEPAPAPALSVVVRTDGLDAVAAEITRLQALQRELEVERRTAGADVQATEVVVGPSDIRAVVGPTGRDPEAALDQFERERTEMARRGIGTGGRSAYPSSNSGICGFAYARPAAP